ncbi:MAG: hypothetical protein QF652_08330 [Dehalococcoidia bacterium]|jgi:hypothetical protein|nr:hypothetical protein [Dehalococcoidia bacterium]
MADDPAVQTQDPLAEEATPPPDLASRLSWDPETQGALPDNLPEITSEDIQAYAAQQAQEAADAVTARHTAEAESRDAASRSAAAAQTDIEYYDSIRTLQTGDDTQRAEAESLLSQDTNEQRFIRGGAAKQYAATTTAQTGALQVLMNQMSAELTAAGVENVNDILPPLNDSVESRMAWTKLDINQFDGKGGLAAFLLDAGGRIALAKAESSGVISQARDEGARDTRQELGRQGAPDNVNNGGTSPNTNKENYGDQTWVNAQIATDPDWAQKVSSDGKTSNIARVRAQVLADTRR